MSVFLDAGEAALAAVGHPRAYQLGSVPDDPEYPYTSWSIVADRPGGYSLDASRGFRFYRITWQSFDRTLDGAVDFDDLCADAFLDRVLAVEGHDCGPCTDQFGGLLGRVNRDPDDGGVITVTSTLTFTATPTTEE